MADPADRTSRPEAVATTVAAVIAAVGVGVGAAVGWVLLALLLLLVGLALSSTLPWLVGAPRPRGTTLVLAGSSVLVCAISLTVSSAGGLRWLTVALAVGLLAAFLHELRSSQGRSQFTLSVSTTSLGLVGLAGSACYVQAVHGFHRPGVVALLAGASALLTAVFALVADRTFAVPVVVTALVVAVALAAYLAWLNSSVAVLVALLATGVTAYGLARMTSAAVRQITVGRPAAAVASGLVPVLLTGVLAYAALWSAHAWGI